MGWGPKLFVFEAGNQMKWIALMPMKKEGVRIHVVHPNEIKWINQSSGKTDKVDARNRQSALGSLVERTTGTTILIKLKNRDALTVRKAFVLKAKKLPVEIKLSMTYGQGHEMAQHQLFTRETQMKVYFAHPASPWERGTNGLIRDFSREERTLTRHLFGE